MGRIATLINYLRQENRFNNYLPIFRIFICFHILKKIFINWGSISLLFNTTAKYNQIKILDNFSFLKENFIVGIPVIIQIVIVLSVLYAFGIGKNVTSVLLFFAWRIVANLFTEIGNGGDNFLFFILLYLPFTNSFKYFSYTKYKESEFSNFLSNLGVYSIMFHLCLIYFVSGIHKVHSDVWFNGVATYYILNLDRFTSPINHFFAKNAFVIGASTYGTILFEMLFPFLIWFKQTRKPFLIAGVLMHLSIYFCMMIYDFEILFIAIYGFFIANDKWSKIIAYYNLKVPRWQLKTIG